MVDSPDYSLEGGEGERPEKIIKFTFPMKKPRRVLLPPPPSLAIGWHPPKNRYRSFPFSPIFGGGVVKG